MAAKGGAHLITRDVGGDSVLVVGADNRPQQRKVVLGGARDGQWIVLEGLASGDRVIVDGFQKLQPGAAVTPVPWTPKPANQNGKGAPGAAAASGPGAAPPAPGSAPTAAPSPAASSPAAAR